MGTLRDGFIEYPQHKVWYTLLDIFFILKLHHFILSGPLQSYLSVSWGEGHLLTWCFPWAPFFLLSKISTLQNEIMLFLSTPSFLNVLPSITKTIWTCQHFLKRQILDSSKLKEFAEDNFNLNENGRNFSKGLKTLWEKEKLVVTCNFSFFRSVF